MVRIIPRPQARCRTRPAIAVTDVTWSREAVFLSRESLTIAQYHPWRRARLLARRSREIRVELAALNGSRSPQRQELPDRKNRRDGKSPGPESPGVAHWQAVHSEEINEVLDVRVELSNIRRSRHGGAREKVRDRTFCVLQSVHSAVNPLWPACRRSYEVSSFPFLLLPVRVHPAAAGKTTHPPEVAVTDVTWSRQAVLLSFQSRCAAIMNHRRASTACFSN